MSHDILRRRSSHFSAKSVQVAPSSHFDSKSTRTKYHSLSESDNLTNQSSSLTSLASTTLSESHKDGNAEASPVALAEANGTQFPSILSVSDLESNYDSIIANEHEDTVFGGNENQQDNAGAWNDKSQWKTEKPIIMLRSAFKSYGSKKEPKVVLQKLNMTIREGSIYGLLGASGCGKTTVLSTIVGLKRLDKGLIQVFGSMPGDRENGIPGKKVGYMPQELALYGEFTICETLHYFGRIYAMSKEEINNQVAFLTDLLDLPPPSSLVCKLSGGQQRRVSFAAALLHNPELLILDEPTVGVDPMLRQSIWTHLLRLSREERKTILITTHYIEEARQADTVGLMRNGKLLAEDSPLQLLNFYNLHSLEDVFLQLCVKADKEASGNEVDLGTNKLPMLHSWTGSTRSNNTLSRRHQNLGLVYPGITAHNGDVSIQALSYCAKNPSQKLDAEEAKMIRDQHKLDGKSIGEEASYFKTLKSPSKMDFHVPTLAVLFALMMKNIIKMSRNFTGLLFVFLLPAIEVIFFCVAIGRDPKHLPLAIVNNEDFNCTGLDNATLKGCDFNHLSCRLITYLENSGTFQLNYYTYQDLAFEAAKEGNVWGITTFHANFSEAFLDRIWSQTESTEKTRNQSTAQIFLDMTNQQVAFTMQKAISDSYSNFMSDLLTDCNFPQDMASLPLNFNTPIYGSANPSFTEFMAPGIIIIIIFFLAVGLTGEAFIAEKQDGLLDRSWVAGVTPLEVMLSHILTQFCVLLVQTAITLVFIFVVFEIPCLGPVIWIIVIAILQGFAGMCFGFLLSTLFSQQTTAMQCAIGSFYPVLLLSGILWPVEGMPSVLQKISWYLPCTAACQAMRDIMAKGWDATHSSIPIGIGATLAWISIFITCSWIAMKLRSR